MTRPLLTLAALILSSLSAFAGDAIDIQTSHHSARELQEKLELEQLLKKYDVSKYIFTRTVVIEERAMNHAFPVPMTNFSRHFCTSSCTGTWLSIVWRWRTLSASSRPCIRALPSDCPR